MTDKQIPKFGTQVEKGRRIKVFANGEPLHTGREVLVNKTRFRTFEQLKLELSKVLGTGAKPVKHVFSSQGLSEVTSLEEIADGGRYVCCGVEPLFRDKLPKLFVDPGAELPAAMDPSSPQAGRPEEALPSTPKKPTVKAYAAGEVPKKFGTQTSPSRHVRFFRNGDVHHDGLEMVIHPSRFRTLDQLKAELSKTLGLGTVTVKKIIGVDLRVIESLEEIVDGGRYLGIGVEGLKKEELPKSFQV